MNKTTQILGLSAAILASNSALASTNYSADLKGDFDKIWSHATLYKNADNKVLQKLAFSGRLQGDYAHFENDENDKKYRDSSWRRFRAGIKATVFNDFTIHSEADMNLNNPEPLYTRLTDSYIAWHPTDEWKLKVGKQSAGFTLDGATSSKKLYRTERSLIAGNIWFSKEYFVGASLSGEQDNWQWKGGVFSGSNAQEFDRAFDLNYFTLLSLGYDFAESFESDKALLRFDYVYQDEADAKDEDFINTADHEHVASVSFQYDNGKKHLHTDLAYAKQFNGNKYYAVQIMPFYDLNDTFQIATSYTHIESSDKASLNVTKYAKDLASKTESTESADEFYLGLNTYLYGHKLKWQNGVYYTMTDDDKFNGYGFTTGIRISW